MCDKAEMFAEAAAKQVKKHDADMCGVHLFEKKEEESE